MTEDADSMAQLERIVTQDPASPLYLPLAERMREQGRVDEAIQLCETRRGRPGEGVGDHIVLGRCYLAAGRLNEARQEFEAAAALDRENVVAIKALAGIRSHEGDHPGSAELYRAVCRIDPGDLESQSALHQITSGEFPEVRPPDLVVAQGDVTWQPVLPPREEEYLPEISLGLPTFETFDAIEPSQTIDDDAPKPQTVNVQDFQELPLERLEVERAEPAPPAEVAKAPSPWSELSRSLEPLAPPPHPEHKIAGNKSAFQSWLKKLQGDG